MSVPGAQPPFENFPPTLAGPSTQAGGLTAILKTAEFAWGGAGVVRGTKLLLEVNQVNGFVCQGCAWPNPDRDRHVAEFCENGAKAVADEATTSRITREFFARHSVAALAAQSDHWLNRQGRLTEPMVLRPGAAHYEPIAWDDAFALLARELHALASPDGAAFYTSGCTSNEAAFLHQLFVRQFGTNNLPDFANMCHEASGVALTETLGIGKGAVTLDDFSHADAIFVVGQNPGTSHPRMLATLEEAKRRGAAIVSINPLPELGLRSFKNPRDFKHPLRAFRRPTGLADLWLQPRLNGDLALFKGLMKELLAEEERRPGEVFDHAFIRGHTDGFAGFLADLQATPWDKIVRGSGVPREEICAAAGIALRAKSLICCWATGLTQQPNAVETIQTIVNFLLLRGHVGRPGAGPCPVRGHSNVQGARTMGISGKMPDSFLDRLGREFAFSPPRRHGLDTVDTIKAMQSGGVKVFLAMGGNFLSAAPDTEFTAAALRRCALTASVSTKLNRGHLVTGRTALLLPCLGRSERDVQAGGAQFVTVEDSMGIISPSRGSLAPASPHLLSEPAIVAGLARATLGAHSTVAWEKLVANYDRIRDHIARVVPGFEDFNARIHRGFFYLPNPVRDRREFPTPSGKACFTVAPIPHHEPGPGEFVMMTICSHDQFNTTIYGLDDRYRGVFNGRRVIFMNEDDIAAAKLQAGRFVDLTNNHGGVARVAPHFMVAPYPIPRRCVATYFPEANVLVPVDSVAPKSNTPTSKYVVITIAPSSEPAVALAGWRREAADGGDLMSAPAPAQ